jgi:hypothetical protein
MVVEVPLATYRQYRRDALFSSNPGNPGMIDRADWLGPSMVACAGDLLTFEKGQVVLTDAEALAARYILYIIHQHHTS